MLVFVIVDDVVLVLADDVHGAQDIQRIVNSSLHIFEIDLLAHLQFYSSYLLLKMLTSQNSLYISKISFAIYVPVTIGLSRTFYSTDFDKNTSFLSFFSSSSKSNEFSSLHKLF